MCGSKTASRLIIHCGRCEGWPTRLWRGSTLGSPSFIRAWGGRRSRRRCCCGRRCCRPSISVRSERQLMEQIDYNLLFRWFVGLAMDDAGLAPDGVHPEPRPAAGGGRGARVPGGAAGADGGQAAAVERALLGRWHADRGLGVDEELPAEGRLGRAAGAGAQRRARFPQGKAHERDARLDHRPGGAALSQGRRPARAGCASWATC